MLLLFLCCVVVLCYAAAAKWDENESGMGLGRKKILKEICLSFIIIYFAQILQKEKHTNSYFFVLKIFKTNRKKT